MERVTFRGARTRAAIGATVLGAAVVLMLGAGVGTAGAGEECPYYGCDYGTTTTTEATTTTSTTEAPTTSTTVPGVPTQFTVPPGNDQPPTTTTTVLGQSVTTVVGGGTTTVPGETPTTVYPCPECVSTRVSTS
ncbi:MAG: hypothetical protein ACHQDC_09010, partial [Acidimicrobiales bacterium]